MSDIQGIVYVLTNPAMPGLVKIGKTSSDYVLIRLTELYSTGVPVPFECAYAAKVIDYSTVEKAFHEAFGPYRINTKREFFMIEPEQAIALLKLLDDEDVTPAIQTEAEDVDRDSKQGANKLKFRRSVFNFEEMGIPIGSELQMVNSVETVIVVSGRKVSYKGEDMALSTLTRDLLGYKWRVNPSKYWLFKGQLLGDIYDDTYGEV